MPTTLGPQDVQLLLKWLEQHYVHVIDPYVGDLEVHMTFIKETDIWPMAKLLLQHAQSQLAAAEEGSSHAALLPQLFSRTRPHSYIHKVCLGVRKVPQSSCLLCSALLAPSFAGESGYIEENVCSNI